MDPRFPEEFGSPGDAGSGASRAPHAPVPLGGGISAESGMGGGRETPGEGRRAPGELRESSGRAPGELGESSGRAPGGLLRRDRLPLDIGVERDRAAGREDWGAGKDWDSGLGCRGAGLGFSGSRSSGAPPEGCSTGRAAGGASPGSLPRGGMDRGHIPLLALRTPGMNHLGMGHLRMGQPGMHQPGMNHLGMGHLGMDHLRMGHPGMGQSRMHQPGMGHLGMGHPGMGQPGMNQPGMNHPGMGQPGMGHLGMNQPGMDHPGMNHLGMGHPGMGQSGMHQPGMGQPGMNHPGMGQPGMGHPGMDHPGMGHLGMGHLRMGHPGMGHLGMKQPGMGQPGSSSPADASAGGTRPAPGRPERSVALGTSPGRRRSGTGGGHPPSVPCRPPGMTEQPCQEPRVTLESAGTRIHLLTPGPSTPRRSSPSPGPPPALQGIRGISTNTARPGATTRPGHDGATPGSCSWCPGRGVPDPPEGTSHAPSPPVLPPPGGASPGPGRSRSPRSLPRPLLLPQELQRGGNSRRMCQWGLGMFWSRPAQPGALWRAQLLMLVLQSCSTLCIPSHPIPWIPSHPIPSHPIPSHPISSHSLACPQVKLEAGQSPVGSQDQDPCAPGTDPAPPEETSRNPEIQEHLEVEPCSVPKAGSGHGSHPQSPAAPPDPAKREILEISSCSGEAGAELSPHSWEQAPCGAGEAEAEAAQAGPLQSLQPPENPQLPPGSAAEPKAQPSQASLGTCTTPVTSPQPQHPPGAGDTNLAVCGQQQLCSEPPTPSPADLDSRLAAVLRRKAKIELSYQQFSLSIAVVATMLLHKEPSMEAALGVALRANLRQGCLHHLQQLEEFIDSLDSMGSPSL
ncbi:elastin-like isoform X2 [Agelaius tricolor]|uniref:elastin-like isoform X2 n=1 Tax=Agelaius tricolor TaxID=9191 RepID=UPI0039F18220